jgi:hypothetical protein
MISVGRIPTVLTARTHNICTTLSIPASFLQLRVGLSGLLQTLNELLDVVQRTVE